MNRGTGLVGSCSECHRVYAVRRDGMIRAHVIHGLDSRRCAGSERPPSGVRS